MGHLKNYSVGDAVAHFHRRTGRRVLHPMGYDAFGLPAENHAIKTGEHPRDSHGDVDRAVPASSSARGASRSTGRASSAPTSRATTAGRSGSSCGCSSAAWPTARRPRSTGARRTRPCWPTSRSSTAAASAAARRSRRASSSSGSSASRTTPTGCSTTSRRSSGPSTSSRCSATGSGAPRARRSRSRCDGARHRLPGLHDAAGHAVRRDLLRHGARASGRAAARRRHGARAGGARLRQPRADRGPRGARRRRAREDRRPAGPHGRSTRSTASGSRCASPTTC